MLDSRMALDERLRNKFGLIPAQPAVHPIIDKLGQGKDPYAFHDEAIKDPPKERKSGRSKTIAQLTGVAKPSQRKGSNVPKSSKNVTVSGFAKLYPALAGKLGQQPQLKQVVKTPTKQEVEKPAESVNKLENKIAQSRISNKQKKAQTGSKASSPVSTASVTAPVTSACSTAATAVIPNPAAGTFISPQIGIPVAPPIPIQGAVIPHHTMISSTPLPPPYPYAPFPQISVDQLAFQPGLIPVAAVPQVTVPVVKETKSTKSTSRQSQGTKVKSVKNVKPEVKVEPVQPFRQITPPSSPITVTQLKIRPRQESKHKQFPSEDKLETTYAKKLYQCIQRKRSRSPDLLPYGIYSSDDSDTDSDIDSRVSWQREWLDGSMSDNIIHDRTVDSRSSRPQCIAAHKDRLRQRWCQLSKATKCTKGQGSKIPTSDDLFMAAAKRDPSSAASVLIALNEAKSWYSKRSKPKPPRKRRKCLHKNSEDKACDGTALPFSNHCLNHITYNVDQQLFDYCTAKFSDNTQCCVPVFDIKHELPLCAEHAAKADNYNRLLLEKPKKPRKKTKPSAMTRPPKKGKKKKNQRRNNKTSKVPSPIPSPEDTETDDPSIPRVDFDAPPIKDLRTLPQSTQSSSEEMGEELEPTLSPGGIEKTLPDLPLDTEGEAKFLDDHDLSEVFNKLPDETFDLFTSNFGKNGDLLPTKEESDALERALAEASKDVTEVAETLLQLEQTPITSTTPATSYSAPVTSYTATSYNSPANSFPSPAAAYIKDEGEDELPKDIADEILDHELSQHSMTSMQGHVKQEPIQMVPHALASTQMGQTLPSINEITKGAYALTQNLNNFVDTSRNVSLPMTCVTQNSQISSGLLMGGVQGLVPSQMAPDTGATCQSNNQNIQASLPNVHLPNAPMILSQSDLKDTQSHRYVGPRPTPQITTNTNQSPVPVVSTSNQAFHIEPHQLQNVEKTLGLIQSKQVPQNVTQVRPQLLNVTSVQEAVLPPAVSQVQNTPLENVQAQIPQNKINQSYPILKNPGNFVTGVTGDSNTRQDQNIALPKKDEGSGSNQIHLPVLQRQLAAGPMHRGPLQFQISGAISPLQGAVITLTPQGAIATPIGQFSQLARSLAEQARPSVPGSGTIPAEQTRQSVPTGGTLPSANTLLSNSGLSNQEQGQGDAASTNNENSKAAQSSQGLPGIQNQQLHVQNVQKQQGVPSVPDQPQKPVLNQTAVQYPQQIQQPFLANQTLQQIPGGQMLQNLLTPQLLATLQQHHSASVSLQNGMPAVGNITTTTTATTGCNSKVNHALPHFVLPPQGSMLGQGSAVLVQPGQQMFQMTNLTAGATPQQPVTTTTTST